MRTETLSPQMACLRGWDSGELLTFTHPSLTPPTSPSLSTDFYFDVAATNLIRPLGKVAWLRASTAGKDHGCEAGMSDARQPPFLPHSWLPPPHLNLKGAWSLSVQQESRTSLLTKSTSFLLIPPYVHVCFGTWYALWMW